MNQEDADKITTFAASVSASVYRLQAENRALLGAIRNLAAISLSKDQADAIIQSYHAQVKAEIERMLLKIGDSNPALSEELAKLLGEISDSDS